MNPFRPLFFAFIALSIGQVRSAEKPNVLFIAIDDLNDYISPLDKHPGIRTPNFDRLAKRSVNFANAHCAAPACHPSRVAVMTGVHPSTSGIYRNMFGARGPRWRHESKVLEEAVVLSQHFRDHGYRAVGGGKIFHTLQWTPNDSQNDPTAWDDYFLDPNDPVSSIWPRPKLVPDEKAGLGKGRPLGGGSQLFGAAPLQVPDEKTGDHMVTDWAIGELKKPQDKPLFLAVGMFRPHIPWEVPQKWFDLYPADSVELPEHLEGDLKDARDHGRRGWHRWVTDNKQWKHLMHGYLASISYVDHQLGRLLDALDASPLKDNTIIVLWSDHGFHIGEKENWEKFALWDQTTRVPLFIDAPGVSVDGAKTRQPVTLTDLYPTLCELAGLPVPAQCGGASLVPQLKDPDAAREHTSLTSFQFWHDKSPSHAVSDPRYRYIRYADGFEELYDLQEDPHEFTNRASAPELAAVKKRLAAAVPGKAAPIALLPKDSPHHRANQKKSAEKPKPNVLMLLVDDLKPALGCYGDPHAVTPHIDRLAARGMRFERAYCNQAVCAPSRFTLMLGSHSTSTGLYGLGSRLRKSYPKAVTIPQHFAQHGYRTESLGKIFHIGHGNLGDPESFSIEHFHDKVIEYLDPASTEGGKLTREEAYFTNQKLGQIRSLPRGAAFESPDVKDEDYADGRVASETIRRLKAAKERTGKPFFIAAGFARPHLPFSAPKKYWDMHDAAKLPLPENEELPAESPKAAHKRGGEIANYAPVPTDRNAEYPEELKRKLIHGYYASVSYTDAQIGRVLDALDELKLTENTIVVLWGDHGFHLGDLGIWTKHTNYEQANRIPIIFVAPGVAKEGHATRQPAESVDIFPTIAELAGLPAPKGPQPIDGVSLVPVLKDPEKRVRDHAFHAYPKAKMGRAIRTERHRLVEWSKAGTPTEYELYDYQSDPLETHNLAAQQPEVVERLKAVLAKYPDPARRR